MKLKLSALCKTAVTLILFYLIFRKVDFHDFFKTLSNARIDVLIFAFLILWLGHYICIFRWRLLMRPLMPVLSLSQLFGIYCIGLFFNLTFPTVVGGDLVKMYYAGKPTKHYAESFASTFLDRDAGMLAMMIIAAIVMLAHPVSISSVPVPLIVWSTFLLFVLANIIIFTPSLHRGLTDILHNHGMSRFASKIDAISAAFQVMGKHRSVLYVSLLISLVNQLLVIAVTYIIADGLRLDIPFRYFLVFVPVITLISMLPISLNGMGLREYSFVACFSAIGVDRESCIALGLLSSLFVILSSIPGGIIYIFFRNRVDMEQIAAMEADFS
jgi:glycosyltransferase 2 family protein